ncbi:hypothetical protein CEXT_375461 [Caerostris extrusa]|uniref:Uncharacterized protein n=1 Tax=Caerostris extrusa TaxID=172846 RepID=A0AAV4Q660_CAEEX|nr:hypothetical protein CEXT_375461 [Caerostris extrusa]
MQNIASEQNPQKNSNTRASWKSIAGSPASLRSRIYNKIKNTIFLIKKKRKCTVKRGRIVGMLPDFCGSEKFYYSCSISYRSCTVPRAVLQEGLGDKSTQEAKQRNRTKWPSISVHTGLDPLPPMHSSALDDHTFDMRVSDASRGTAEGKQKRLFVPIHFALLSEKQ